MEPSCERAPDALGQEENEHHEDRADRQRPRLRPHADRVFEDEVGGGTDERAEERAGAAEQRHDDDLPRRRPVQRLDRDDRAAQRVVAAGPVGQMEADEVEELREGQREHREVDAAAAQAEEPDDRAAEHRGGEPHAEREPQRRHLELGQRDARAIRAESPVRRRAERQESRVAVKHVEAEREEAVDQHLRRQRLVRHQPGEDREDDEEAQHHMPPHPRRRSPFHSSNPASPSRPLGRNSSTSAMKTKTMISASFGAKNVVRPTIWPIRSPEMKAPSRLPMPPTTTTTNDSMMMVTPISA